MSPAPHSPHTPPPPPILSTPQDATAALHAAWTSVFTAPDTRLRSRAAAVGLGGEGEEEGEPEGGGGAARPLTLLPAPLADALASHSAHAAAVAAAQAAHFTALHAQVRRARPVLSRVAIFLPGARHRGWLLRKGA